MFERVEVGTDDIEVLRILPADRYAQDLAPQPFEFPSKSSTSHMIFQGI
ncbi:Uncharacterised protein [Arcanobacterium haemolyticum]|nr:Uncharacterised protein [Arcanobacterium haemolyticum]